MLPKVGAESSINACNPIKIVDTDHIGFHVSGWKSDMDKHKRVLGLKRPEGVNMRIEGGLSGYSGGNLSLPW